MSDLEKAKNIIDKDIIQLDVEYIDFDGNNQVGIIEIHKSVCDEVKSIFEEIKQSGFIIEKIKTIDNYNYDDEESVKDNNTSGYNFRFVSGTTKLSDHAVGLAIDINPALNPWLHPSALNIFRYDPSKEGTIVRDGAVVKLFEKYGWSWGGNWKNPDFQHFFKGGDLNKSIKNNLYEESGIENPYLKKSRISKFKDFIKRI